MAFWTPISPWRLRAGTARTVAIGATSASSTAMEAETRAVMITASSNCHISIGPAPQTAVATGTPVLAGWPPIILACGKGDVIATIQDSADGTLSITELTH